jgi:hypothetical protein
MRLSCTIPGCAKTYSSRGFCQMHKWRVDHYGDPLRVRPSRPVCSVDGCCRTVKGRGLCSTHFGRHKRGIPLNYTRPLLSKTRYRLKTMRGRPLADRRGRVYEHRAVLFESIAWMRVPCFWCGKPVSFSCGLVPDHLDHDRQHNALRNLVPACNGCNAGRTRSNPKVRKSIYENWTFPVGEGGEFVWDDGSKVGT